MQMLYMLAQTPLIKSNKETFTYILKAWKNLGENHVQLDKKHHKFRMQHDCRANFKITLRTGGSLTIFIAGSY